MSMMPGSHKADNDAMSFPYPPPMREDNTNTHNLNYCAFLFGEVIFQECIDCPYLSCLGKMESRK